jgi:hypothetical protein
MTSLAFWLDVNCDPAILDILVQRRFKAITDDMCIRDRHHGGNDEMKLDEDNPAGTSSTQIMDFERTGRASRYSLADRAFHVAVD